MRTCLDCQHCVATGENAYGDSLFKPRCTKGHWEFDEYGGDIDDLRRGVYTGKQCSSFEEAMRCETCDSRLIPGYACSTCAIRKRIAEEKAMKEMETQVGLLGPGMHATCGQPICNLCHTKPSIAKIAGLADKDIHLCSDCYKQTVTVRLT